LNLKDWSVYIEMLQPGKDTRFDAS
jgi:hypothetical protein